MHIRVKISNIKYYARMARVGSRISRPLPDLARADPRVDPGVDPRVDPSMDNPNSVHRYTYIYMYVLFTTAVEEISDCFRKWRILRYLSYEFAVK